MKLREQVGLNIRNLRNSKGMSQEQLALAADVDRSYISEMELAKNSASIDILEQIALALDVAPKELFNERGLVLPEFESVRTTAEAIGRISCIKTGEEIGLLYQWDNGETQAALYVLSQSEMQCSCVLQASFRRAADHK